MMMYFTDGDRSEGDYDGDGNEGDSGGSSG